MSKSTTPTTDAGDEIITEFLSQKGTMEMIVKIGSDGPQRFSELDDELLISPATIRNRYKRGKALGICTLELEARGRLDVKVYALTPLGNAIYRAAENTNLDQLYEERRELIRTIESKEIEALGNLPPSEQ